MFPGTGELSSSDEIEQYQEERRLFYVAMTRAKKRLYFFKIRDKKSSFLQELFPIKKADVVDDFESDIDYFEVLRTIVNSQTLNIIPEQTNNEMPMSSGKTLREIVSGSYINGTIVQNILTRQTYTLKSSGRDLCRVYSFNPETGEIGTDNLYPSHITQFQKAIWKRLL